MERKQPTKSAVAKAFGLALRDSRLVSGQTQEQLANISKLHRTSIGLFERGIKSPSLDTFFRLANALGTTPQSLIAATCDRLAGGQK